MRWGRTCPQRIPPPPPPTSVPITHRWNPSPTEQLGLGHAQIIPSGAAEDLPKSLSPFEYVVETAKKKAMQVYRQEIDSAAGEPALIIAADTVVVSHRGAIVEKPRSEKEHVAMLRMLRDGPSHKVYTAVVAMAPLESAVSPGYALETAVDETVVYFDNAGASVFFFFFLGREFSRWTSLGDGTRAHGR